MSLITTGIVTFVVIAANIGFTAQFYKAWLSSWPIAYLVAVPAILIIAPRVEQLVSKLIKN
jgi:hypothetical protein